MFYFVYILRAICIGCQKIQGHYGNTFIVFITIGFGASDL